MSDRPKDRAYWHRVALLKAEHDRRARYSQTVGEAIEARKARQKSNATATTPPTTHE